MPQLSKEQQDYLNEELVKAGAFEEMIRTKGWELVLAYYSNCIQQFTNGLILQPDRSIEDFRDQRNELIGLRKMISNIDGTLKTAEQYRKKEQEANGSQK